jgi:hypothetical protein
MRRNPWFVMVEERVAAQRGNRFACMTFTYLAIRYAVDDKSGTHKIVDSLLFCFAAGVMLYNDRE